LAACFVLALAIALCSAGAGADIYNANDGAGPQGNLSHTSGVLTIDTTALTLTAESGTYAGEDDGGVAVFRFNNIAVTGGSVTAAGSRPLAIAAVGDITWAVPINASAGVLGGGAGGNGGPGATAAAAAGQEPRVALAIPGTAVRAAVRVPRASRVVQATMAVSARLVWPTPARIPALLVAPAPAVRLARRA
jgi:hypothetical protein